MPKHMLDWVNITPWSHIWAWCHPEAHIRLGGAYADRRQYEQAVVELKKGIALDSTPERMAALEDVYARWGKTGEAYAVVNQLIKKSKHTYVPPDVIAGVYARLGE